jgi:hypothetical protein
VHGDINLTVKKPGQHPYISAHGQRKKLVHVSLKRLKAGQTISPYQQFFKAVFMQPPVESTKPQLRQVMNISSLKTAVPEGMIEASIIISLVVIQIILLVAAPIIPEEWRSGM